MCILNGTNNLPGQMINTVLLVISLVVASTAPNVRCSVPELRGRPGYAWTVQDIRGYVRRSDVVVRAQALDNDSVFFTEPSLRGRGVRFVAQEVLQGSLPSDTFVIRGTAVDMDEFNDGEVPYRSPRMSAMAGSCFASSYKRGGEYLFLLKGQREGLSPYWVPLAPVNEQVRGAQDPWVVWVRNVLSGDP